MDGRIMNALGQFFNILFELVLNLIAWAAGILTFFALLIWILMALTSQENSDPVGSPFTIAQVAAIFGGFGLVAGFSAFGDLGLRRKMRIVGVLYLLSALGFSLMGMLLPFAASSSSTDLSTKYPILISWGVPVYLLVITGSFAAGTVLWLSLITKLICKDNPD